MPGSDHLDLEERLRRLPAALAVDPAPGLLERVARHGRRRRRLRRVTAVVAVVALFAGVLATRAALPDRTSGEVLNPGQVQDATAARLASGHGQALPPNPVVERLFTAAVAWTGQELIVWGGATRDLVPHADGAAYDPRSGRWRPLPPAPQAQMLQSGEGIAVWTGRELLIWGGLTPVGRARQGGLLRRGDGLAYEPATRTWRLLSSAPSALAPLARPSLWTGSRLLVVDADADNALPGGGLRGAAYDRLADRWRLFAPSPRLSSGQLLHRTVVWAGTRLLVWSFWSRPGAGPTSSGGEPAGVDLWAYDPAADDWTVLPSPSGRVRSLLARASLAWTGQEFLAVQHTSVVALPEPTTRFGGRYDLGHDRWTPVATPPVRVRSGGSPALVWIGAALLANGTHAYDPTTDRWWRLPAPDGWTWTWISGGRLVRRQGEAGITMLVPAAR